MFLLFDLQISMFYSLGSVLQHYWCNIYTTQALAQKLSVNHKAVILGMIVFVIGELICYYHHALLAGLRSPGKSNVYVTPQGGLFKFVVCPHYFG